MRAPVLGISLVALIAAGCPDDTGPDLSALTPEIELPSTIDFGEIPLGAERRLDLVLDNTGDGTLRVSTLRLGDDAVTEGHRFELDSAGFEVAPGASVTVGIRFTPLTPHETPVQVELTVISNLDGPRLVQLEGRGVLSRLEVRPDPVDFGNVLWGSDVEVEVEVINRHDVPAELFVPLDGDGVPRIESIGGAGRFEVLSSVDSARSGALLPLGQVLEPDEAFTARLRYVATPDDNRAVDQGRWWLSSCAPSICATAVDLRGAPRTSAFDCSPASLDFDRVDPGDPVVRTATCTNVVSETVDLLALELDPGPEGYTVLTPPRVQRLEPGDQFVLEVEFSPPETSVGRRLERTVQLVHRRGADLSEMRRAPLLMSGLVGRPRIVATPGEVRFSATAIGTFTRRTVRIGNGGQGPLAVRAVEATGPFETDAASFSVGPGSQQDVEVRFVPLRQGEAQGTLRISSDDPDEPVVEIALGGLARLVPPCNYALEPASLELGAVGVGRGRVGAVSIRNEGGGDCLLNDLRLTGPDAGAVTLLDARRTDRVLTAGTSTTVALRLVPETARRYEAALELFISDPGAERVEIPIVAQAVRRPLVVQPLPVRVGPTVAGCGAPRTTVRALNSAADPITLAGVSIDAPNFQLVGLPSPFPAGGLRLVGGQQVSFGVELRPGVQGPDRARLRLEVDALATPYFVPVERFEDPSGRRRVRFEPGDRSLDLLFVATDSAGFFQEQAGLPSAAARIVGRLDQANIDYRIGVLRGRTIDPGCPQPATASRPASAPQGACGYLADGGAISGVDPSWRVVDRSTLPSPSAALGGLLVQTLAPSFNRPRIFDAVWAAVSDPIDLGWNVGLRRPDAAFAVIYVSDNDDMSALDAPGLATLGAAVAGGPERFVVSGPSGPRASVCIVGGLSGDRSPRLAAAAELTGGVHLEICEPGWPEALVQRGLPISGHRSRFPLPEPAAPGTVRVEVGGVEMPAAGGAWTIGADGVDFSPAAIPPAGAPVEIEYQPVCR